MSFFVLFFFPNIDDAKNKEHCVVKFEDVDEVLEMMRIEEEPHVNDKIRPMRHVLNMKVLPISKVLKLYTTQHCP